MTYKAVRPAGSYVGPARAPHPLSSREKLIENLTDKQQQVYWCLDLAGEAGLTRTELTKMMHLHVNKRNEAKCQLTLEFLEGIGVIRHHGSLWSTQGTSETTE